MRFIPVILMMLFSSLIQAQPWFEISPDESRSTKKTLVEYQKAFNDYWEGKQIENGYYFENGKKQKAYGWKQFKRWEHFWESRVNVPDGNFPSQRQYDEAYRAYRQSKSRSSKGRWMNLGPASSKGGYAGVGRINQVVFHPTDPNMFWVTTPAGGLWTTEDAGLTWRPLTDMLENLTCTSVAIPSDYDISGTIYLGTGEMDSWQHDNGIGLLKSTDGGLSWQTTGLSFDLTDSYAVNRILIHPNNDDIIYAATTIGLYKSIDAGVNWDLIFDEEEISDMEFKPDNPSIILAANKQWGRIYKLTQDGTEQTIVYNDYGGGARRIELAPSPSDPEIVYAVVVNIERGLKHILKSTDGGDSYSIIFTPDLSPDKPNLLGWSIDGSGDGGQGYYDLTLIVDPSNPNILFCGGVSTWKSVNGGLNWNINSHWTGTGSSGIPTVHADKHYMAYNGSTLYECNDGGLYKTDDGKNWQNISNGIINSQMYKLGVSQTVKYDITAGLQDNGSKNLLDSVWSDVLGGDGMECLIDYTNAAIQYAESQFGILRRTTDHWKNKKKIKPEDGSGPWVTPYIIDPIEPNILYAGYQHVYKTTDRGDNWEIIFDRGSNARFRCLAMSKSNTQVIYASEPYVLWKTTDSGEHWEDITTGLPQRTITSIAVKHDDPNMIWVTLGGYNAYAVFQSEDGGSSWKDISVGIPPIPVNTIVHNQQKDEITELYAGTDFGVYLKLGEANWQFFNNGMPKTVIAELEIYYDTIPAFSKIRAATYGRGLWESDLYSIEGPPLADFSGSDTVITIGSTVDFTDESSNSPYLWNWEFEGGIPATSTRINPSVIYRETGVYKVSLTVSNGTGENTTTKEAYITVVCPDQLNYLASKAISFSGIYEDLGDKGEEIVTANFDDANSAAVDIGFVFDYNCQPFDSFVLNTNGFIKLGRTAPSAEAMFFGAANTNEAGIFNSDDPADQNLISIFNHDLIGVTEPEYRVFTEGTAPHRVCIIQFEGITEKSPDTTVQYDDMQFQIKLFETSNIIEFVFGDWVETSNLSTYKTSACGLKAGGNTADKLLIVGKASYTDWSDVYFQNANYMPGYFGFNFGNPEDRTKPDRGRTYRFTPIYFEDLSVGDIYALSQSPAEFGNPEIISAVIHNRGYSDLLNVDIELNISGDNSFRSIKTVPKIAGSSDYVVSFEPYQPENFGFNELSVSVPVDADSSDNSRSIIQHITEYTYNYAFGDQFTSSWGVEADSAGIFSSKFIINGAGSVNSSEIFISDYPNNVGQKVWGVILDREGNILTQSDTLRILEENMGSWYSFKFPVPIQITDGEFYTGMAMTKSINENAYYPLGVQQEVPSRKERFYYSAIGGGTLFERDENFGNRYMIGATVSKNVWTEGTAASKDELICYNSKAKIKLSKKPADIQWEESDIGIGGWEAVKGGFGANLKTYLSEYLFKDRYFRAKLTFGDSIVLYSNVVYIKVAPRYAAEEVIALCAGTSFTFPDGKTIPYVMDTIEYKSLLQSVYGCDSIIVTILEVSPAPFQVVRDTICSGTDYIFPDGFTLDNIDSNMTYESIFPWSAECDSIIVSEIFVERPDVSITETDTMLIANLGDANYQWLDCANDFAEIEGAVDQSYSPPGSGYFAVSIDDGHCLDVSSCIHFIHTSTSELDNASISIYPNPTEGVLIIKSDELELLSVEILDVSGKSIISRDDGEIIGLSLSVDLRSQAAGIYIAKIITVKGVVLRRVVLE